MEPFGEKTLSRHSSPGGRFAEGWLPVEVLLRVQVRQGFTRQRERGVVFQAVGHATFNVLCRCRAILVRGSVFAKGYKQVRFQVRLNARSDNERLHFYHFPAGSVIVARQFNNGLRSTLATGLVARTWPIFYCGDVNRVQRPIEVSLRAVARYVSERIRIFVKGPIIRFRANFNGNRRCFYVAGRGLVGPQLRIEMELLITVLLGRVSNAYLTHRVERGQFTWGEVTKFPSDRYRTEVAVLRLFSHEGVFRPMNQLLGEGSIFTGGDVDRCLHQAVERINCYDASAKVMHVNFNEVAG